MEPIGRWLRQEREVRQISLEELAQTTRIPLKMLQHLEDDRHDQLPGEVFTRGFLKSYARAIGIAERDAVERWSQTRKPIEPQAAPVTAITPPDKSRRFGIAIALVILLILFTLALSIVLRPRHRDAPVQLSSVTSSVDIGAVDIGAVDIGAVDIGAVDIEAVDIEAVDIEAVDVEGRQT